MRHYFQREISTRENCIIWRLKERNYVIFTDVNSDSYTFPPGMFNYERQYVHSLCKKHGLLSASHGAGEKRRLTVSRRSDDQFKEVLPKLIPDDKKHIVDALRNYKEKGWQNNKKPKLEPKFRLEFHSKPSLPTVSFERFHLFRNIFKSQYNRPTQKLQGRVYFYHRTYLKCRVEFVQIYNR